MNFDDYCTKKRKDTLDKWTSNINAMFIDNGRDQFKVFLKERDLDDASQTVEFWEKCDTLQSELKNIQENPTSKVNIYNTIKEIVKFAEDNVNFYENQMSSLEQMLHYTDAKKIYDTLEKAKKSALDLLQAEHQLFSQYLINEYKNFCKK